MDDQQLTCGCVTFVMLTLFVLFITNCNVSSIFLIFVLLVCLLLLIAAIQRIVDLKVEKETPMHESATEKNGPVANGQQQDSPSEAGVAGNQPAANAPKDEPIVVKLSLLQYQGIQQSVKSGLDFCKKLAENDGLRETFFRQAVNSSSYQSYSPNDFFTTLRFFFGNDLFDCFGHLGHSIHSGGNAGKKAMINYRNPEGQALYATLSTLMETPNDFKSFREEILSINQTTDNPLNSNIRETTEATLQVYLNSGASITADGVDDFNLVLLLRSFGREEMIPEIRQVYLDFANAVALSDNEISDDERAWLDNLKEKIVIKEIPQQPKEEERDSERNAVPEHEPLFEEQQKSPMRQLNELIGLRQVKSELQSLTRFIEVNQKRKEAGLRVAAISYHCVFAGNPGTGKTTVARILAGIYRQLGILKKGQLIETDRSGLVAEYVGQTAVKTNKMIDRAIGGVLFIDEAYTLAQGGENDYGREAIATLLKRMEDERDRLVVILAGYTNEIEQFINSNPGLRSRFNRYVHFDDYTEEELFQIFILQAQKYDYHLDDEAKGALRSLLHEKVENRQKDFGNARYVRNLFESVIENQAVRLSANKETDKDSLAIITKADIHE